MAKSFEYLGVTVRMVRGGYVFTAITGEDLFFESVTMALVAIGNMVAA